MDNPLVLSKIFSFLCLSERLRMRLVCKAWYGFVNDFERRGELCVYEQTEPYKLKWSTDGADVRELIQVDPSKLDLSKDPFLKSLKRLFVYRVEQASLLQSLNSLTNLEELYLFFENFSVKLNLNLPNLKTLTFGSSILPETVLNTPRLENLRINHISSTLYFDDYRKIYDYKEALLIAHPDSIRSLIIDIGVVDQMGTKIKLPNLRRLVLGEFFGQFSNGTMFDLEHFPKLKSIEIYILTTVYVDRGKEFVKLLEKQRSVLGRSDLQILMNAFRDVENSDYEMFEPWVRGAMSFNFKAVWRNLNKMVGDYIYPISFTFEDYQLLREYCPTIEERRKFMDRFKMLKVIKAVKISDPAVFLEFLNEWGIFVEYLILENPGLLFTRYSQQLTAFQNIRWIEVRENEMTLNYDFLLDLRSLKRFSLFTLPCFFTAEQEYIVDEIFRRNRNFEKFTCHHIRDYGVFFKRMRKKGVHPEQQHKLGSALYFKEAIVPAAPFGQQTNNILVCTPADNLSTVARISSCSSKKT